LRTLVTGVSSGPSLANILEILGYEKVQQRIEKAIQTLSSVKS